MNWLPIEASFAVVSFTFVAALTVGVLAVARWCHKPRRRSSEELADERVGRAKFERLFKKPAHSSWSDDADADDDDEEGSVSSSEGTNVRSKGAPLLRSPSSERVALTAAASSSRPPSDFAWRTPKRSLLNSPLPASAGSPFSAEVHIPDERGKRSAGRSGVQNDAEDSSEDAFSPASSSSSVSSSSMFSPGESPKRLSRISSVARVPPSRLRRRYNTPRKWQHEIPQLLSVLVDETAGDEQLVAVCERVTSLLESRGVRPTCEDLRRLSLALKAVFIARQSRPSLALLSAGCNCLTSMFRAETQWNEKTAAHVRRRRRLSATGEPDVVESLGGGERQTSCVLSPARPEVASMDSACEWLPFLVDAIRSVRSTICNDEDAMATLECAFVAVAQALGSGGENASNRHDCCEKKVRMWCDSGGMQLAIDALRDMDGNSKEYAEVVESATAALSNALDEHVFSQDLFMQLGGLETVVQALLVARDCAILEGEDFKSDSETESKDGEDSEDETSWVSVAVGLLVTLNYALQDHTPLKTQFLQLDGAMSSVIGLLNTFHHNVEMVRELLQCCTSAISDLPVAQTRFAACGGFESLFFVVRAQMGDNELVMDACELLLVALDDDAAVTGNKQRFLQSEGGTLDAILQLHNGDEEVTEAVTEIKSCLLRKQ